MRYLIFNVLLLLLIIVILLKVSIITNECFTNNQPTSGIIVSTEPVKINIIYTQEEIQQVEPSDEVFAPQYAPPFIQPPAIQTKTKVQPAPPEQPQISIKDVEDCKIELNNRIKQINSYKAQKNSERQNLVMQQQMDDQQLNLQNAIKLQQYKANTAASGENYQIISDKLTAIKTENANCKSRIDMFNYNFEQVRNCCKSETERVQKLRQTIYEQCVVPQAKFNSHLSNINNEISATQVQINQFKTSNDDLQNKIINCK